MTAFSVMKAVISHELQLHWIKIAFAKLTAVSREVEKNFQNCLKGKFVHILISYSVEAAAAVIRF